MTPPTIKFDDILEAFAFVNFGEPMSHEAFLSLQTGKIYYHSEYGENEEPLPDDLDEPGKYIVIPHKNDMDLGTELVGRFVAEAMPDATGQVQQIFSRRGAYGRFKAFVSGRGMLDRWHKYEQTAHERALREWCKENGLKIDG